MFWLRNKQIIFSYTLLSGGLKSVQNFITFAMVLLNFRPRITKVNFKAKVFIVKVRDKIVSTIFTPDNTDGPISAFI